MGRVLLALLRPLHTIAQSTLRIADALDRAYPKRTSTTPGTYIPYDEDTHDEELDRRAEFERRRGRPLSDDEELPLAFDHTDRLAGIKKFLGLDDHQPD